MSEPITAFKVSRSEGSGWIHAGTEIEHALEVLRAEMIADQDSELPPDELGQLIVERYLTTQEEIDSMPEFQGW